MSRIGKKPITIPRGVDVSLDGSHVTVKGPKGTLEHDAARDDHDRAATATSWSSRRPDDERRDRALHGLTRSLVANMVAGVSEGFSPRARDRRRRVPRHRRRARTSSTSRSATRTRSPVDAPEGVDVRGARTRPASRSAASTSSSSARSPPTSARSASPSPTRARASATPTSASCARPASRRSSAERIESDHAQPPSQPGSAATGESARRSAAPRRVRASRCSVRTSTSTRRSSTTSDGTHARVGVDDGEADFERRDRTVEAAKKVGKRVGERAKSAGDRNRRVRPWWLPLPRSGGRRLPTAPAKPGSSSKRRGAEVTHGRRPVRRASDRHQPGRQGRQGRPAVLVHRARGRGRRRGQRRVWATARRRKCPPRSRRAWRRRARTSSPSPLAGDTITHRSSASTTPRVCCSSPRRPVPV